MKELNRLFLEKSELQLLGFSILFAFFGFSQYEVSKVMFPQINFPEEVVFFFSPGETGIMKKTDPKKLNKRSITYLRFQKF